MSELKILSNHPSIQNIEDQSQTCIKGFMGLSVCDMNKLFTGMQFPKFELMDLKANSFLIKHQEGRYFLLKLQKWNASIDEQKQIKINNRTQFLLTQFIYSSLKRICILPESEIEKQLQMLYKWYTSQSKVNNTFSKLKMPSKIKQNEFYDIKKTYKTNPTLLIQQYNRPRFLIKQAKNYGTQRENDLKFTIQDTPIKNISQKKCLNNNFLTQIQNLNQKNKNLRKCSMNDFPHLKISQIKARESEMRQYLQKKQIQLHQWNFKVQKGRLISQTTKNYYQKNENFNTAVRPIQTGQQSRPSLKNQIIQEIKRLRVKTSMGKRLYRSAQQQSNRLALDINQIYSIGLLTNPLERKVKRKKKNKK